MLVAYGSGLLPPPWRRCDTVCTSGFVDAAMFALCTQRPGTSETKKACTQGESLGGSTCMLVYARKNRCRPEVGGVSREVGKDCLRWEGLVKQGLF